jgi:hypothetical protein
MSMTTGIGLLNCELIELLELPEPPQIESISF